MPEGLFARLFKGATKTAEAERPVPKDPEIEEATAIFMRKSNNLRQEFDSKYGAFWKIDPTDVADLYLLMPIVQDSSHMYARGDISAREGEIEQIGFRLKEIGEKLAFSVLIAEVDEFAEHDGLSIKEKAEFQKLEPSVSRRIAKRAEEMNTLQDINPVFQNSADPMRVNIGIFLKEMQKAVQANDIQLLLSQRDLVYDVLRIFETAYVGKGWNEMATWLRLYLFPHRTTDGYSQRNEKTIAIEQQLPKFQNNNVRDAFLLDRIVNAVHTTGNLYPAICNDFTKVGFLLYMHGEKAWVPTFLRNASSEIRTLAKKQRAVFGENFSLDYNPTEFIATFMQKISNSDRKNDLLSIMLGFDQENLVEALMQSWQQEGRSPAYIMSSDFEWDFWRNILPSRVKPDILKLLQ